MKLGFRGILAVAAAKAVKRVCRLIKRAGTSLPGRIAVLIDPGILARLSSGFRIIEVTGTNGKTTTTGMISQILDANGIPHIVNKGGANMMTGIVTAFIDGVNTRGESSCKWAVLEVDEATVGLISKKVHPEILIVTNFFRDQLDRYGETHSAIKTVLSGIERSQDITLVLNADDSFCAYLGVKSGKKAVYFGIEPGAAVPSGEEDVSAASYCLFCKSKYDYSYKVIGHLGGFRCPGCGFERPDPQVQCAKVESVSEDHSVFRLRTDSGEEEVLLHLPGLFNIYNALAAVACCGLLGLSTRQAAGTLKSMESCFGRMESFPGDKNKQIMLMLVKNPTGFNQILHYLTGLNVPLSLAFLINDRDQDGTDISWLWDVDFEQITRAEDKIDWVYASGLRAEDMALRLKYAGLPKNKLVIQKDYPRLIDQCLSKLPENGTLYIAATYTAMMDLRTFLREKYSLRGISE